MLVSTTAGKEEGGIIAGPLGDLYTHAHRAKSEFNNNDKVNAAMRHMKGLSLAIGIRHLAGSLVSLDHALGAVGHTGNHLVRNGLQAHVCSTSIYWCSAPVLD